MPESQQNPNLSARWDFSDMLLAGETNKSAMPIIKHINPKSDIYSQKELINEIYRICTLKAFDGQAAMSENGPTGILKQRDFSIDFPDHDVKELVRFRVHAAPSIKSVYFYLRKINSEIPSLATQGFSPETIRQLLKKNRRGLVLFGGEMGMGKTSAASGTIIEWLETNGGIAVTLEDPPEYRLHGKHGKNGMCIQQHCLRHDMAQEIPGLMRRCAPEIIFLGEIRSPEVAHEAILAASNGHLVVSTIHGKGLDGVLNRILTLATSPGMSIEDNARVLADSLSLIVYQKLDRMVQENQLFKILEVSTMDLENEEKRIAFAASIRDRKMDQLRQNFERPIKTKSNL